MGIEDGHSEGKLVDGRAVVGIIVGAPGRGVGTAVDGAQLGTADGKHEGSSEGQGVGIFVGFELGLSVGWPDGCPLGSDEDCEVKGWLNTVGCSENVATGTLLGPGVTNGDGCEG